MEDKDSVYGVRDLERILGLSHQRLSKFLNSKHNDLATHVDGWKWHPPVATDEPVDVRAEVKVWERNNPNMRRKPFFGN